MDNPQKLTKLETIGGIFERIMTKEKPPSNNKEFYKELLKNYKICSGETFSKEMVTDIVKFTITYFTTHNINENEIENFINVELNNFINKLKI